ncbi:hypothetical protein ASG54_20685 [Aureimonas sp. Leaf460]|nr:hypothetical protein ASG62_10300 [Aureimonas sp. Leaf427]KQT71012.1 hypothetical protein ASG54_20685 [Aureimonas sp. Leaf460]
MPDPFCDPDRRFRPAAFWFWHRLPSPAEISARLSEIATSGLGTILIQARLGMPLETYLSPAFLDAYRFACSEAMRLGLGIEIYDEYNWMSGHGGGRVVAGAGHLRERHLVWASGRVESGALTVGIEDIRSPFLEFLGPEGLAWCYEGGEPRFDEWTLVAIADETGADRSSGIAVSLEPAGPRGCHVRLEGGPSFPDGTRLTVFLSARCATSRLVNYLLPETAERFAETVYAPLVEAAGGAARAVFFDHPYAGFYRWRGLEGDFGNSFLWDADLPRHLGPEPLSLQLYALVGSVGETGAGLRARFFAAYSGRMHEAFFGTLRRWCDARGLAFSGHELLTHVGGWDLQAGLPGIDARSMPGVDHFGLDAYRSETAVDAADFQPQLAARFGDSLARANGRSRCTIEQYATGREIGLPTSAGQWSLTLETLRAQSIRHTLFGARRILLHALYLDGSSPGERSDPLFDFPPGYNLQPWWADAPAVMDELTRLSAFLEEGEPVRPVGLLYPLETIRAEPQSPDCARHFGAFAEALAKAGIGYDIVDESAFASAGIADGRLVLPSGRYDVLILPAVTTLASGASAELIERFSRAGGRLVASGPLPSRTRLDGDPKTLRDLVDRATQHPATLHFADAPGEADHAALAAACPPPGFRMETGSTWATSARFDGAMRIAAFNDGATIRRANLDLGDGPVDIRRWHAGTGERERLGIWPGSTVTVELDAGALLCLEIRRTTEAPTAPPTPHTVTLPPPVPLGDGWTFSATGEAGPFRPIATDRGWERQGFARFAGTGLYRRKVDLSELPAGHAWHLVLPGLRDVAAAFADGEPIGCRIAGEAAFSLPVSRQKTAVEIAIRNTAANLYYAGTIHAAGADQPSGILAPPRLEARPLRTSDIRILPRSEAPS